jgi:hypothetical protein
MIRRTTGEMLKIAFPNITFPPNKYIDLVEPTDHISDKLYFSNLRNEDELYNILNKNRDIFRHTPRYCELDFIAEIENANIFIELKSRNIKLNAYKSTIFPLNKIEYYRNLKLLNRGVNNILLLIFSFIDENGDNNYYYIQYNKDLFSSYNKMKLPNGIYYNILIKDLKPLEELKIIS